MSAEATDTLSGEQTEASEATVPDPVAVTRAAAILPPSSKPSYCNVPYEPDKTVFPTLSDDADPWALPEKTQDLQGLTAGEPTSELARRQDGTSENTTYHLATGKADDSVTDIDSWKTHLPPYATNRRYHQLNGPAKPNRRCGTAITDSQLSEMKDAQCIHRRRRLKHLAAIKNNSGLSS